MKNDGDMDLYRLFEEIPEPEADGVFVERVNRRIGRRRRVHRLVLILLAFPAAAILTVLTPWLTVLTGDIALGTNLFAQSLMAALLSPAGCSIGGTVGLLLLLRTRS